jgi:hypothetical protein
MWSARHSSLAMIVLTGCSGGTVAAPATHHAAAAPPETHVVHRQPPPRPPLRPPQFVMISFDGSGDAALWKHWREVGHSTGARFTFFLSGVYLLDPSHSRLYHPPRHSAGTSDIGFSPDSASVRALVAQLNAGRAEGHEIGTHYNGHFCEPYAGNVSTWTAADWRREIEQWRALVARAGVQIAHTDLQGGRTPCLQGRLHVLRKALHAEGMSYDTSETALPSAWPVRKAGIWSFPLASIKLVGTPYDALSMDYNFLVNQPSADPSWKIERDAYRSYVRYFEANYRGGRAPIDIGNHFARWHGGAYIRALTRFVDAVCPKPEVRCVTYSSLVGWLDRLPARVLARYRAGRFPHLAGRRASG